MKMQNVTYSEDIEQDLEAFNPSKLPVDKNDSTQGKRITPFSDITFLSTSRVKASITGKGNSFIISLDEHTQWFSRRSLREFINFLINVEAAY